MNTKVKKIKYALEHNPLLIPSLMKDTSISKGMLYGVLKRAVPCRIGIEFELAGSFGLGFIKEHPELIFEKGNVNKMLTAYYNVLEIKEDDVMRDITPEEQANEEVPLQEIRISISDFKQLVGLYKFMQDLSKYCRLHSNGGIHIHVDLSNYVFKGYDKEQEIHHYIKKRLHEVAALFPKYKGKYNKRDVGIQRKATWVNISRLKTLEFRIAPLSFEYSEVIKWVLGVVKFRQNLIHYTRLKPTDKMKKAPKPSEHGYIEFPIGERLASSTGTTTNISTPTSNGTHWQVISHTNARNHVIVG